MPKAGITVESCIIGTWEKKVGDEVKTGDTLAILYTNKEDAVEPALKRYLAALKITSEKTQRNPLVYKIIR